MKNQNTRRLVESALMIAIGTVLSELKIGSLWAFGGGLTIGSMVPLVIFSHRWGTKWGTFTAFVYSLLQMILGIDNIQYATGVGMAIAIILLDYIIAYTVVGLSSMFGSGRAAIIGGVAVTLGIRFLCHFLTGWMIWDALWPNEFGMTSVVYSLCYNGSYMLPEIVITAVLSCVLVPWVNKTFPKTYGCGQGRPPRCPAPPGSGAAFCVGESWCRGQLR